MRPWSLAVQAALTEQAVAGRGFGPVDDLVLGVLGLAARQELPLRAAVGVLLGIVGERALAEERRAGVEVGQREERPDAGILDARRCSRPCRRSCRR